MFCLSRPGERLDCQAEGKNAVEVFPPRVVAEAEKLNGPYSRVPSMISDELRTDLTIHHMDAISIVAPGIIIEQRSLAESSNAAWMLAGSLSNKMSIMSIEVLR